MTTDYNARRAVVTVRAESFSGTSGPDRWPSILKNMYLKWAERHRVPVKVYSITYSEDNALSSVTFMVDEPYTCGLFAGENGIHQFTRVPLPGQNRVAIARAEVTVLPGVHGSDQLDVPGPEIQVERMGAAVRMTHRPTGIVADCQGWLHPWDNKAGALYLLRTYLLDKRRQTARPGGVTRDYLDGPVQLVTDLRSGHSDRRFSPVLTGRIDGFLQASSGLNVWENQTFMGIETCTSERSD